MTAIDPLASGLVTNSVAQTAPAARAPEDQFGKDTFLKLLVAQLRYQNPLAPKDGTEFLSQTAQFTMVEKLQEISDTSKSQSAMNEVLASSTMIGRTVTFGVANGETPQPMATTQVSVGGSLPTNAPAGTRHDTTVDVFTKTGQKVTLRLEFGKLPNGNDWEFRAYNGTQQIAGPTTVTFDAAGERTSGDITIPATVLDSITGTGGGWPTAGMTITFGSATDTARLRNVSGAASVAVREQNGSDGHTLTGIVTGVRFDVSGPLLRVGTREIPMTSVMEVHLPTV